VLHMLQWDPSVAATRWKQEDLVISTWLEPFERRSQS
jgi:hypothetical protein